MKFFELFIVWRYIRGGKKNLFSLNARLSFFGVFVGTSLLVVVLSIFNGFPKQLRESIFRFDPHLTIENIQHPGRVPEWKNLKKKIKTELGDLVLRTEGMIQSPAILRIGNEIDHIFIRAREFEFDKNSSNKRYRIPDDFPASINNKIMKVMPVGDYCLIGSEMAYLYDLKVGDRIQVIVPKGHYKLKAGAAPSMKSLKIAGYFTTGNYQYDVRAVVLSLPTAQRLYKTGKHVQKVTVKLKDFSDLGLARKKLILGLPTEYNIRTIEDEKRNEFMAVKMEKTVMIIIVSLFILAAMVGLMVGIFQVVRSRKRDIGVLKTLGLSDYGILTIFTLIGFSTGAVGTIIGIAFGVFLAINLESILNSIETMINGTFTWYYDFTNQYFNTSDFWIDIEILPKSVYYFEHLPVSIDLDFLLTMGISAIFISGIASLVPAWYAARLEPIDIIRGAEK